MTKRRRSSVFNRLYYKVEGYVAKRKVNSDLDETCAKFVVGSDAGYAYALKEPKVDHSNWNSIMKNHVYPGQTDDVTTNVVDYHSVAADENLDKYRQILATTNVPELESTPNEMLALYINAYNCFCIGHVTRYLEDNGELPSSVTKTTPKKGKEIWDMEAGVVGGESLTLNDIEHKILRSKWADPRVHASIVCASASCPNLRREAFVPHRLNEQMDDQARTWVGDTTKGVHVDVNGSTFSRIFLWFEGDFKANGGPVEWAKQYLPDSVANLGSKEDLKYFTYNWSLNRK